MISGGGFNSLRITSKNAKEELSAGSMVTEAYRRDFLPRGLSKLLSERSTPEAARLSPRVSAPRDCRRRATAAAKRCSPPMLVIASLYMGALTWQQYTQHQDLSLLWQFCKCRRRDTHRPGNLFLQSGTHAVSLT